jgi:hypothetical protein
MRTYFKIKTDKQVMILELLELSDHPETGPP